MQRNTNFTFRVSSHERQLITALAARLDRTESDAVRWLIREAARELGLGRGPPNQVLSAEGQVLSEGGDDDEESDQSV